MCPHYGPFHTTCGRERSGPEIGQPPCSRRPLQGKGSSCPRLRTSLGWRSWLASSFLGEGKNATPTDHPFAGGADRAGPGHACQRPAGARRLASAGHGHADHEGRFVDQRQQDLPPRRAAWRCRHRSRDRHDREHGPGDRTSESGRDEHRHPGPGTDPRSAFRGRRFQGLSERRAVPALHVRQPGRLSLPAEGALHQQRRRRFGRDRHDVGERWR